MNFGFQSLKQRGKFMEFHTVCREKNSSQGGGEETFTGNVFSHVSERFSRSNPFSNALNIQMHKYKLGMPHPSGSAWGWCSYMETAQPRGTQGRASQIKPPWNLLFSVSCRVSQWSPFLFMQFWFGLLLGRGQRTLPEILLNMLVEIMYGIFLKIHLPFGKGWS